MTTTSPRPVPEYQWFRPIFAIIVGVVWFVLLLGFGLLIALQLPGDEILPSRLAWRFFLVGFFPICLFAASATFIGFLQQYLAGAFLPPSVSTASEPPMENNLNPWGLGLHRLVLYWLPAVLLATIVLWLVFPEKIGRDTLAFVLALLGAPLASGMALASIGNNLAIATLRFAYSDADHGHDQRQIQTDLERKKRGGGLFLLDRFQVLSQQHQIASGVSFA